MVFFWVGFSALCKGIRDFVFFGCFPCGLTKERPSERGMQPCRLTFFGAV